MEEGESGKQSAERPQTAPGNFGISVRQAFDTNERATAFAYTLGATIREISRHIDLSELDGVTVAGDYHQALLDLDRGYETSHKLTPSDGYAIGVAMTPSVIRDSKLKSHMFFNAVVVAPLESVDDPDFLQALHVVVHECAHVEVTKQFDQAFPNVLLRKAYDNLHDGIRWQIIMSCWDEFAATWISAPFGKDPTADYEETFLSVLIAAREDANERIKAYRLHGDVEQVMVDVYGIYGRLMKFAAYHLGNMCGRGFSLDDLPKTRDALAGHWFAEHFKTLDARCRAIADAYGEWTDTILFEAIGDLADAIVEDGGLHISHHADGTFYVDVPFSPDTMPD